MRTGKPLRASGIPAQRNWRQTASSCDKNCRGAGLHCDKCGNETFEAAYIIKNIPGLVLGNGSDDVQYPLDVVVCKKCGAIMKDYRKEYKLEEFAEKKEENKSGLIL